MHTSQLRRAMHRQPVTRNVFGGVYARDRIPDVPKNRTVAYIVNTDPSNKPGRHWVCFFLTRDTVYYFDSYGRPPIGFRKIWTSRRHHVHFRRRIQGNGQTCGHYCLYFIYAMMTDQKFSCFGDDLNANDVFVQHYIKQKFQLL